VFRRGADFGSDWNRLIENAFGDLNGWTAWAPAANLYETGEEFVLEMGLPGFDSDSIDVNVERGILTVSGNRTRSEEDDSRTYHVRELSEERFTRSFSFPASVRADDVRAEFHDGMLVVTLPKSAEAKPRRVRIGTKK
jgi:HSP20 family protein